MPIMRIELLEGRSTEQKRALVRELTDVVVASLGCEPAHVRIIITDVPRESWSVGGELMLDRP